MLFLDTGAILALVLPRDGHHQEAVQFVRRGPQRFVTTSQVLAEVATLVNRRRGPAEAAGVVRRYLALPDVEMIWVDASLFASGIEEMARYRDKGISMTDAISFAVMRRRRLTAAFAFDDDFRRAGFETRP